MSALKNILLVLAVSLFLSLQVSAADPPVKKSKSDICHPKDGTYYSRTKNYTPYQSMADCIKSGGRKPKK